MSLAIGLQNGQATKYLYTTDPSKTQAERAADFGKSERQIRRYETYLRGVLENIYALFEPVTFPLPQLDRTKRIRPISFPSTFIGVGTNLGLILTSYSKVRDIFAKEILAFSKNSNTPENDLKVIPSNSLSDDKGLIRNETDTMPREPEKPEPECIQHFCKRYNSFVHMNRMIEHCSCGLTFDDCLENIGDSVLHIKICGGNL